MKEQDKIVFEETNWWRGYNGIFDYELTPNWYTQHIYNYLCRCANGEKKCWPSYERIMQYCNVGSRSTVNSAIKELKKLGLLKKERRTSTNGRSSNLYIIAAPKKPEEAAADTADQAVGNELSQEIYRQLMDNPSLLGKEALIQILKKLEDEEKKLPESEPDQLSYHGKRGKLMLTNEDYARLIQEYGQKETEAAATELDLHMASSGKDYKDHAARLEKWILDNRKKSGAGATTQEKSKRNRFANFEGRKRDYAEIERLEQELLIKGAEDTAFDKNGDSS